MLAWTIWRIKSSSVEIFSICALDSISSMVEMEAKAQIEKISPDDDLIRQIAQASMEHANAE